MVGYKIITWPEIQELMECPGFNEHATLIEHNEKMGIEGSTYLVDKTWFYKYD